jgi:hypothetical protein
MLYQIIRIKMFVKGRLVAQARVGNVLKILRPVGTLNTEKQACIAALQSLLFAYYGKIYNQITRAILKLNSDKTNTTRHMAQRLTMSNVSVPIRRQTK